MANKTKRTDILSIDPRNIIVAEGFNSRISFDIAELKEQIRAKGVLNPITVQIIKQEDGTEKYRLVDGERRTRACMALIEEGHDIPYVRAIVVPSNLSKEELYIQQAMKNEGKNFNEYEWAILANKMRTECGITNVSEIARKLNKNPGVVIYWLQILDLPEKYQELVRTGKLCGSDLRRILQSHNKDNVAAWDEIEKLQKKAEEKGEEKLSLKDLDDDFDSKTKVFKDSKALLKGLNILFSYIEHFKTNAEGREFNLKGLHDDLKAGKVLTDIFGDLLQQDFLDKLQNKQPQNAQEVDENELRETA